jgi:hypothetical protein
VFIWPENNALLCKGELIEKLEEYNGKRLLKYYFNYRIKEISSLFIEIYCFIKKFKANYI